MDDHFTLQWNDYQNHLMNAFTSLRNDKDFVDLTLSCEGRKISSHKMLLSACSPYFRGLLKDNPCPHPVIILRQTSYEDLVAIIHFVYNASEFGEEEEESVPSHEDQPQRKKVKLEDEEDEFGKDWTFDYGGSAGDIPDESSTPNAVIAEGSGSGTVHKRRAISIETKMDIIKRKEQGERTCQIAQDYGIAKSTISTILKNGESIKKLSAIPSMMGAFYDTRRSRSGKMHEMERILNMWIEDQNSSNQIVNGPIIQEKAREIWVDIGGPDDDESKTFVASNGWFERFRKRFNLQMVKNVSRPTSQKRRAISLETKLDILKRKDRGDRSTDIANAYGFGTSTVCTILKNRDQILKLSSIPCMMGSFYDTTRTRGGKMHEMERILNTWILEQNEMNSVLNGPVIQEKAREIWVDIGGLDEEDGKKFVASNGWFTRFRKRNNLQIVKNIGRSDNNASSTGSASFSSS
ncbi:unnamed protein product [Lepeophtheirus salmonis]|uniref:(salmon louse) hypothetical protein n=1 Tax=Lepeophtheirus salmonis TaxID=72036 RepID=A0A7R8CLT0_LEPSM|nr:unnamed protein product [Lepeophtheirus salmonis]CAF2825629.1 unnamed protein product [Lepeophtheirus salmonis]